MKEVKNKKKITKEKLEWLNEATLDIKYECYGTPGPIFLYTKRVLDLIEDHRKLIGDESRTERE